MAGCTKVHTEWGYVLGGVDTDATAVDAGKIWVKAMAFAGNADDATCSLTNDVGGTATTCYKFKTDGNDLDASSYHVFFGDTGVPFTNLTATLSHANDRLYIYLR